MKGRGTTKATSRRFGAPAMWAGIAEQALAADIVLPEQFHDIWSHSGSATPERALAVAVLAGAMHDLQAHRFSTRRRRQRLYWEAFTWVMADDRAWPYAFVNLCESLGVNSASVRQQMLAPTAAPAPLLDKAA